jgi:protein-S-isoprenylcysteine O-methyltransferase Ste14
VLNIENLKEEFLPLHLMWRINKMKKDTKIAFKRFIVLLIVLAMFFGVFAGIPSGISSTAKIVVGSILLGLLVIYWIVALILIRRKSQKEQIVNKENKQ